MSTNSKFATLLRHACFLILASTAACGVFSKSKGSSDETPSGNGIGLVGDKKAVVSVVPGACDSGKNHWNHPVVCGCPANFVYNPVAGLCDGFAPAPAGTTKADASAVLTSVTAGPSCMDELNQFEVPQMCQCAPNYWYNPVSGFCDTSK